MINFVLQILCSFLFATGLFFILIDLRTKYDRSFRFFGASLLFLCAMAAIDIWLMPLDLNPERSLIWQKIYHIMACFFVPFSLWYLFILTGSAFLKIIPYLTAVSVTMAGAFITKLMIVSDGKEIITTMAYNCIFVPFVAFFFFTALYVILKGINKGSTVEKRILRFHLVGFAFLFSCGILDIADIVMPNFLHFTSFTIIGVLGYGLMASWVFTEKFLVLIKDRENTFTKLESAYKDLEQVNNLKQIGESTAMINHEIKNYMFMISGNAQVLQEVEALSPKGTSLVNNIVSTVERLSRFSNEILDLSRTQILKEKYPVNLTELIKSTIEKHYAAKQNRFSLQGLDEDNFIFGDWGKLEHVFVNLFKNSFEAGQGQPVDIKVKITGSKNATVVTVEDNGVGCNQEELEGIFKAFYTTKKSQGGTGLGMSITRTIVESHGGKISAYSKNLTEKDSHGLKMMVTFPIYSQKMEEEANKKHPIVVITEGMDNLPDLIRVFQNLCVNPRLVQDVKELNERDYPLNEMNILVSAKTMADKFSKLSAYPRVSLVSSHEKQMYILDHSKGSRAVVFSEEYVVSCLLRGPMENRLRRKEENPAVVLAAI